MDGDDATGKGPSKPRRRSRLRRQAARNALPWIVIIAIFVLWEIVVRAFDIEQFVLPAPTAIFASGWEWRAEMLDNAWQTFMTTAVGFMFAVIFGLVGGVLFGSSTLVYDGFYPALVGFNSIPKVAVIPILVIWFGIGTVPAIVTAFLISFFPILVNVAAGIATVEPELNDVLRALGARRWQIVQKVGLPRSMPYFFASLKVAITFAFVGSIVAETAARLRRAPGDEHHGHWHVSGGRIHRAPNHPMGDPWRRRRGGAAGIIRPNSPNPAYPACAGTVGGQPPPSAWKRLTTASSRASCTWTS
jgi:NitT/TauT family transport system permease protein